MMPPVYAVIAKTTQYETVLDSVWEKYEWAKNRVNVIWDYPDIFHADVRELELNEVDGELDYELTKDEIDDDEY